MKSLKSSAGNLCLKFFCRGFGYLRLQYVVDDEYVLFIPYMRDLNEPFGLTGEDLLLQLIQMDCI